MGRRTTLAGLVLAAGVCHFAAAFSPADWVRWLSQFGKLFVTGSFGLLYLYTSELFPTVVRNAALGSCSMVARVGSIAAPFLKEMGQATTPWAPSALCGVLALVCGILALMLPETKDRDIPDTLQEGEDFDDKAKETPNNAVGNTTENSHREMSSYFNFHTIFLGGSTDCGGTTDFGGGTDCGGTTDFGGGTDCGGIDCAF